MAISHFQCTRGISHQTSAAVLQFAYDEHPPIQDGNSERETEQVFFPMNVSDFDHDPHQSFRNIAFFTDDSALKILPKI
jgi:adenine-specific DNA glycosylase